MFCAQVTLGEKDMNIKFAKLILFVIFVMLTGGEAFSKEFYASGTIEIFSVQNGKNVPKFKGSVLSKIREENGELSFTTARYKATSNSKDVTVVKFLIINGMTFLEDIDGERYWITKKKVKPGTELYTSTITKLGVTRSFEMSYGPQDVSIDFKTLDANKSTSEVRKIRLKKIEKTVYAGELKKAFPGGVPSSM